MSLNVVALPPDLAAQLPGVRLNFVLDAGTSGFDMTKVTAARCRVEKPDHSYVDWLLSIEGAAPAPTTQDVTVYHLTAGSDFAASGGLALAGTYVARFFATFSAVPAGNVPGEQACGKIMFAVEPLT